MSEIILGEGGIATTEFGAIDLEKAKEEKIKEIDKKTERLLNKDGVVINFDFGNGVQEYRFSSTKTAKMNWMLLLNVARDCIGGLADPSLIPPVQTFPDEHFQTLSTPQMAFSFCYTVLSAIESVRGSGAFLKNQVSNATTVEEIEAITDNR